MKIYHIGFAGALCNPRLPSRFLADLGYARLKQLGVKERFRDEAPYRVCKKCLKSVRCA